MTVTLNVNTEAPKPPAPSAEALAKAAETHEVTDSRGRVFKLRRPTVVQQYQLVDMLGASAKNEVYMGMVLPLTFIIAIDGENEVPFQTRNELTALLMRLGEDGVNAVVAGVQQHFSRSGEENDRIKK